MERLSVLKALADDSRYAIFVEMSRGGKPLSTAELAERLELHPNTVRLHLERLKEVGLVESTAASHGAVGRPQHHWALTAQAPSLGLEPAGYRVLAHLLAEAAADAAPDGADLGRIGSRMGVERSAGTTTRGRGHSRRRAPSACLQAVVDELADLGFDPVVEPVGDGGEQLVAGVAFNSCPFRELAAAYPDLVCTLHRGVTAGIVAGVAARTPGVSAELAGFSTLVDADPCRAELAISATD